MRYISTRGQAPELGFADVLLAGLATDGGLYVPTEWPSLPSLPTGDYASLATAVMRPYVIQDGAVGDIDEAAFEAMCRDAKSAFHI